MGALTEEKSPTVEWLEEELVSIIEIACPRTNESQIDYAIIVNCVRRLIESDLAIYDAMVDRVRARRDRA